MTKQQPLVIVCDPEDSNIAYYTEVIEAMGARCVATSVGGNVVNLVESHQPALVILDSQLEEPDGYQTLNLLKSGKKTRPIPVLLVVSNLSERKMCLYEAMVDLVTVLSKPVNERQLQRYLQHYLAQYAVRAEIEALYSEEKADPIGSQEEGILALDAKGQIVFANFAAEQLLKANSMALSGVYLESLFEEGCTQARSRWSEHPVARVTGEDQILQVDKSILWRRDGESISAKFAAIPFKSNHGVTLLFAFKQLKDTRESKDKLAKLSQVDHLTNLPTRAFIEEHIDRTVLKAGITGYYFAVLSVDLDHFRHINESLGHDRGDTLLKAVADRIHALVRRDDQLARLEGDEFVLVLSHIDSPENAGMVANKVIERIREPFLLDGHEVFTGCSIGVSVYPNCGDDATTLMKNAEAALARAKAVGRNHYQYYTVEMNKLRVEQMQLEYELHLALEQKQWRIQYLPVTSRDQADVVACEVRLSWLHPHKGELALEAFLQQAEEAGLAPTLFRWLWQQALARFDRLPDDSKSKVRLILPISPAILLQEGGVDWVINAIAEVGLGSHQIYIELPESYYSVRHQQHSEVLNELCRNGFNLILDSFGTGYAPLNRLKEVPYTLVKLSESFVAACELAKTDQAIIKGVVDMVHQLGIQVLATSVDRDAQQGFLQSVGCDWLSGDAIDRELERTPQKLDEMGIFVFPG
ncbi:EAL domain-containing protein [Ketobacter sp.]|uniref:two-component system response regulator n=1 Tax=Ketobacter sp. TaxID=2083498 RepID=UPI000F1FC0F8|nr:EAL domain-containing protein [Ketobacter sp.]RLU01578.1 MAG: EAL domain-containing protein [Ketobacter sp.]